MASAVSASSCGTRELTASYDTIINSSRIPDQGKRIQAAFEAATARSAKNAGLRSARVAVANIQNMAWKEYLKSIGYVDGQISLYEGNIFSTVMMKTVP